MESQLSSGVLPAGHRKLNTSSSQQGSLTAPSGFWKAVTQFLNTHFTFLHQLSSWGLYERLSFSLERYKALHHIFPG